MEVSSAPRSVPCRPSATAIPPASGRLKPDIVRRGTWIRRVDTVRISRSSHVIRAIEGPSDLPPVEITWQITAGAVGTDRVVTVDLDTSWSTEYVKLLVFALLCPDSTENIAAGITPFVVAGIEFSKRIVSWSYAHLDERIGTFYLSLGWWFIISLLDKNLHMSHLSSLNFKLDS